MTFEVTPEVAREMPGAFTSYIEDLNKYKDWVLQGAPHDGTAGEPFEKNTQTGPGDSAGEGGRRVDWTQIYPSPTP